MVCCLLAKMVKCQRVARQNNGARETTIALQKMLTAEGVSTGPIDGCFGIRTKRGLQAFLRSSGYAVGPVDGIMGYRTTCALQEFLRDNGADPGPIDGRAGPRTAMALHLFLATRLSTTTIAAGRPVVDALPVAEAVLAPNDRSEAVNGTVIQAEEQKEFAVNDMGEALVVLAGVPDKHAIGSAAA